MKEEDNSEISENQKEFEKCIIEMHECSFNIVPSDSGWTITNKSSTILCKAKNDEDLKSWWKDQKKSSIQYKFIEDISNIERAVLCEKDPMDIVMMLKKLRKFTAPDLKENMAIPAGWRIGQYIFNLLEQIQKWQGTSNHIKVGDCQQHRLADTFYIQDSKMMEYIETFNKQINS